MTEAARTKSIGPKKTAYVVQAKTSRDVCYRVTKLENTLSPPVGAVCSAKEIEALIASGVRVRVTK